jgi:hypothetical protein
LSAFTSWKAFLREPTSFGDAVQFVIEHIAEALGEDEGQDVVLVLRCVLGPRMEQAASQIQDSRDLSPLFLLAISVKPFFCLFFYWDRVRI